MAKATLPPNPRVPWDQWVADYGKIRDAIAKTYPDIFHDFNARARRALPDRESHACNRWNPP
jgi:hypothetical protein